MTSAAQRLAANTPGGMRCHSLRERLAHDCGPQELEPEDLDQTLCDAIPEYEKRRCAARTDQTRFALHQQFLRAHGIPKGEFTTFVRGGFATVALSDERRGDNRSPRA